MVCYFLSNKLIYDKIHISFSSIFERMNDMETFFLLAGGLLVIPENHVSEFKKLLIGYYENKDNGEIKAFLKQNCHRNFR